MPLKKTVKVVHCFHTQTTKERSLSIYDAATVVATFES